MSDQFITVKDVNLRYRDTGGNGPALLLTHGIGSSLETWSRQEEALGKGFRVISWDLPGHGLSGHGQQPYGADKFAETAWALLDALKVDTVTLSGNSLGAAISIRMLAVHAARVKSLVLLNGATLGTDIPLPFKLMLLPILGAVFTKPSERSVDMQIKAIFHPDFPVTDEIRALVRRNAYKEGGQQSFVNTLRALSTLSGQRPQEVARSLSILSQATCPVVFAHGRQDDVLPLDHSVNTQRLTPGSELLVLENCGHTPQIEKPDEVNRLLMRYLQMPTVHSVTEAAIA